MSSTSAGKTSKYTTPVTATPPASRPLHDCIKGLLASYFADLDGHKPGNLFDLVMDEVELPLLEAVMHHTRGNQSRAAEVLGLNRGTLRKKLHKYGIE